MSIQLESPGSHYQKIYFDEIPILFYLIIFGYHSTKYNSLFFAFRHNLTIADKSSLQIQNMDSATTNFKKYITDKTKIKSGVCASYLIFYNSSILT